MNEVRIYNADNDKIRIVLMRDQVVVHFYEVSKITPTMSDTIIHWTR